MYIKAQSDRQVSSNIFSGQVKGIQLCEHKIVVNISFQGQSHLGFVADEQGVDVIRGFSVDQD